MSDETDLHAEIARLRRCLGTIYSSSSDQFIQRMAKAALGTVGLRDVTVGPMPVGGTLEAVIIDGQRYDIKNERPESEAEGRKVTK